MAAKFRKDADHPHFGDDSVVILSDEQFGELKALLEQIRDAILAEKPPASR